MLPGTLSFSDLYGPRTPAGDATTTSPVEKSSGGLPSSADKSGIAMAGLIMLLVIWRVLAEANPSVGG